MIHNFTKSLTYWIYPWTHVFRTPLCHGFLVRTEILSAFLENLENLYLEFIYFVGFLVEFRLGKLCLVFVFVPCNEN